MVGTALENKHNKHTGEFDTNLRRERVEAGRRGERAEKTEWEGGINKQGRRRVRERERNAGRGTLSYEDVNLRVLFALNICSGDWLAVWTREPTLVSLLEQIWCLRQAEPGGGGGLATVPAASWETDSTGVRLCHDSLGVKVQVWDELLYKCVFFENISERPVHPQLRSQLKPFWSVNTSFEKYTNSTVFNYEYKQH